MEDSVLVRALDSYTRLDLTVDELPEISLLEEVLRTVTRLLWYVHHQCQVEFNFETRNRKFNLLYVTYPDAVG